MKQTILDAIEYKEINMADLTDASELYETLTYDGTLYEIAEGFVDIYYYSLRDFRNAIQVGQQLMLEDEARDFVEEIYTEYLMKQELTECSTVNPLEEVTA